IIIRSGDSDGIVDSADAAPCGHAFFRQLALGEPLGHADMKLLAELEQLVIGQGESVVLNFRQRRNRDSAALAHFLERPSAMRTEVAKDATKGRLSAHLRHPRNKIDNFPTRIIISS